MTPTHVICSLGDSILKLICKFSLFCLHIEVICLFVTKQCVNLKGPLPYLLYIEIEIDIVIGIIIELIKLKFMVLRKHNLKILKSIEWILLKIM